MPEIGPASESDALLKRYSPFLLEIRRRIFFTLFIFVLAMIAGFVFYEKIIKFIVDILSLKGINIVFTSPFQFINLAVSCAVAVGFVSVFPLLLYQILSFLKPALQKKEYRLIVRLLPFTIFLFILGFLFGIIVMKWQIQLFLTKSVSLGIGNILDISKLIGTVLLVSAFMGIAFQFPIILILLTRLGIVSHQELSKQRLWVYLGSLLFTILFPIDSVLADILLALPIVLLYELTILIGRFKSRKG